VALSSGVSGELAEGMAARVKTTVAVIGGVAVAATAGSAAADPGSAWYRGLRKPRWQPPPPAYALVWTPLYVAIAYAGARALSRAGHDRSRLARTLFVNLALNGAWTPLFFRARQPGVALADIVGLNIANVLLIRRAWRADRAAAALLAPYAAWTAFATALNAEIVRLNPSA
jgi:translocator protein